MVLKTRLIDRMTNYVFGKRSEANLIGVHPDLVRVVRRALELTEYDFGVIEGVRTREKQAEYVLSGASQTMDSRHITGHAVDLYPSGKPTPWHNCKAVADAMYRAAKELDVSIVWGGSWKTFVDQPHFELNRSKYP